MSDQLDRLRAALTGRYDVEREIGHGGMATVYLARDVRHERPVALKVLRPDLAAALGPERFLREIKIAAALQHPHILPVYDSGRIGGQAVRRTDGASEPLAAQPPDRLADYLFYVMPYVEGESLREHLRAHGELPIADAVRILRDVAEALAAAHAQGVVHRDIKPDNVLLSGRNALVTDFGVAKAVSEAAEVPNLTATGVALGTPAYMAPEQATAGHVDQRADIYAFGVLAYEMLTGRPPFEGATAQALLAAHVADEAPSVTTVRATVPPALDALVTKCLAKRPADRWQTAEELLSVLEGVSTPGLGVTPTETAPVPAPRARSWRRAAVGGAVLVALGIGGYGAWQLLATSKTDNHRVAVKPFENQTGIDSLDTFGLLLANLITDDLDRSGVVGVVPTTTMDGIVSAGITPTPKVIAAETDAALLINGSYHLQNDSLAVRTVILDIARDRETPVKPVLVARNDQRGAIDQVRQRVRVALSALTDTTLKSLVLRDLPVSLEAYGKYVEGLRQFGAQRFAPALASFSQAFALDSSSVAVRLMIANTTAANNTARADTLLRGIAAHRADLTPVDRNWYDWLRAYVDGDNERYHQASTRLDRLRAAQGAFWSNHWDEARRYLDEAGRSEVTRRTSVWYWQFLTLWEHWNGDYQRELDVARQGLQEFVHDPTLTGSEIRALAALGRGEELQELLTTMHTDAPRSTSFWMAARELRLHGHPALADSVGRLAVGWYRAELGQDSSVAVRQSLATALFDLGELDEARTLFEQLAADDPKGRLALGYLGVIAARGGDSAGAEASIERLGGTSVPYMRGRQIYWQGVIAAALGQCERAVAYLSESYRKGQQYIIFVDGKNTPSAMLAPIAECPAFKRFVKPRE